MRAILTALAAIILIPVAALVVACIILSVTWRLARQTIDSLLDATPPEIRARFRRDQVPALHDENLARLRRQAALQVATRSDNGAVPARLSGRRADVRCSPYPKPSAGRVASYKSAVPRSAASTIR